jgi:hypothetical protein
MLKTRAGILGFIIPLLALCVFEPYPAKGEPPSTLKETATSLVPPPSNAEVEVRVGVYVLNLVSLDEVKQAFACTGYLTETWNDPRLAFTPQPGEPHKRSYEKNHIWLPLLQFDNATDAGTFGGSLLTASPDGTVHYTEKFNIRLSSNMHFRSFPFDEQNLEIYFRPFTAQVRDIVLTPDSDSTGVSEASYAPLPLWDIGTVTYRSIARQFGNGAKVPSRFVFEIHIRRHSEYYVYRILLPLFLMVAISWGVLWIPPSDLNSQLLISVTTVLTLVAFSVAVSNVLPPVPYITFYDGFFLVSFFFIMLTIGEAIIIHTMHGRDRKKALRVRTFTRLLFLPLFFASAAVMAFVFLR